jgi:hypothetical protein
MAWLPFTESLPGDGCPRCERGTLYVRNSRPFGSRWQLQYLWCTNCPVTFKARADRRCLPRLRKVV